MAVVKTMKTILMRSAWMLVAVSLAMGSMMNTTAGDKDKQQENNKGQDKEKSNDKDDHKGKAGKDGKDGKDRGHDDKDKDRDHHGKDKDKDHDDDRHKVTICHRGHTLSIPKSALQAHLNHGDTLGSCEVTPHKNK